MSQTVSFSFLSLFQFCGFKILTKLTEFTLNLLKSKSFWCKVIKICFKKIAGHKEGFFVLIMWLLGKWTRHHPQEDLVKFLVQIREKSRKNPLVSLTCKNLYEIWQYERKPSLKYPNFGGAFQGYVPVPPFCCGRPPIMYRPLLS
jgi:hypothetical protein